jgi:hypothetical protein
MAPACALAAAGLSRVDTGETEDRFRGCVRILVPGDVVAAVSSRKESPVATRHQLAVEAQPGRHVVAHVNLPALAFERAECCSKLGAELIRKLHRDVGAAHHDPAGRLEPSEARVHRGPPSRPRSVTYLRILLASECEISPGRQDADLSLWFAGGPRQGVAKDPSVATLLSHVFGPARNEPPNVGQILEGKLELGRIQIVPVPDPHPVDVVTSKYAAILDDDGALNMAGETHSDDVSDLRKRCRGHRSRITHQG